jgi:two-component system, cell cycle sensor histidine kinase and response regulator CckA
MTDNLPLHDSHTNPDNSLARAGEFVNAKQKQTEHGRESEARLQALIGCLDEIIFEFDVEGTFLNIWASSEQLLYRPRHEMLGKRVDQLVGEDFFRPFRPIFRRVLETGHAEDLEYPLDVFAGRRWFLARVNRLPSSDGSRKTVCMIVRDITDRKQADEKLKESEEKFSKAFHSGPDAITLSTMADGRFIEVNDNYLRLTGFTRDEVIGRTVWDVGTWRNRKERELFVALLKRDGEVRDLETQLPVKSGEVRTIRTSAHIIDLGGSPCIISILRDITARKILEEELRQAQKMEAVGRLAGGVAHDFNNLLVGILGYSELLKNKLPEEGPLYRMADEINAAAMRARDLTSRLLALSRRQVLQPKVLDFNALVRQAERLLRPIIGEDIRIVMRLDPKTGPVKADPAQLEQVILNLALNARDAMPQGGILSLETCNIRVDAGMARQHSGLIPGSYVRLSVTDTGRGIRPEIMARIFEPFFTTKDEGKGGGLGLSTVYGIVKQSGGCVTVASEQGKGAAFGIFLPRANQMPEKLAPAEEVAFPVFGTETILIVEDEPVVRKLARDVLEERGYRILCASSGPEALRLSDDNPEPIQLLITDVVMPEMSGPELANLLQKSRPQTRVLYMSGYTDDEILCRKGLPENSAFIQKPYTPEQFARKVYETLRARLRREQ